MLFVNPSIDPVSGGSATPGHFAAVRLNVVRMVFSSSALVRRRSTRAPTVSVADDGQAICADGGAGVFMLPPPPGVTPGPVDPGPIPDRPGPPPPEPLPPMAPVQPAPTTPPSARPPTPP